MENPVVQEMVLVTLPIQRNGGSGYLHPIYTKVVVVTSTPPPAKYAKMA